MYGEVNGSFVAAAVPRMARRRSPGRRRTFPLHHQAPVPVLDPLMANILITPAGPTSPRSCRRASARARSGRRRTSAAPAITRLARNKNYWGSAGRRSTEVQVRFVPEESSRVIALASASSTSSTPITPDSAEQLRACPASQVEHRTQHPDHPAVLQLPQARRAPARRPAGARGPDLRDRRRGADQRRAHRLGRPRPRAWSPLDARGFVEDRRATPTTRRQGAVRCWTPRRVATSNS